MNQSGLRDANELRPLAFFIYGSLLPKMPLNGLISPITVSSERVICQDMTLYTQRSGDYPYLVPRLNKHVQGELMYLAQHQRLLDVVTMEIKTGYSLEPVTVHNDAGTHQAHAFVWNHTTTGLKHVGSTWFGGGTGQSFRSAAPGEFTPVNTDAQEG